MTTIEQYIRQHALERGESIAMTDGKESVTYGELWTRIEERAEWYSSLTEWGEIVAVRCRQTIDFLIDYFALHLCGAVAMPLEHDLPQERFDALSRRYAHYRAPEGVADVLFTTGTTGTAKGVMVSHRAILADCENLISRLGFRPDTTFIICGPLNHIGSLSKVHPVMQQGGTLYLLEGMKDMGAWYRAIEYGEGKVATFMVPASIRMLLSVGGERLSQYADRIDFIECGGAALPEADMRSLCRLLPHTRLYNTYASTETGIVCSYDYNVADAKSGCMGTVMPRSLLRIDADGRVICGGDTIMSGYADEPEMTSEVLCDGEIYTADQGWTDSEGMLHLSGRADDVINIGGYKVSPVEVEDAAYGWPQVKDCICVAEESDVWGTVLKLIVQPREGEVLDRRRLARHIAERLERYKVPMVYEETERIERTYNGKLNRKAYAGKK